MVDAYVSGAYIERCAGSTPVRGTQNSLNSLKIRVKAFFCPTVDGAYGIEWEDADVTDGVFVLFVFSVKKSKEIICFKSKKSKGIIGFILKKVVYTGCGCQYRPSR